MMMGTSAVRGSPLSWAAKANPASMLVIIRSVMTRSGASAVNARLRLGGVGRGDHAVAGPLEDDAVDLEEVEVVVDDEYQCLVCAHAPPSV